MSATIPDFLETLQEDARWRLASDPVFASVPVFLQRKGDIENDVLNALSVLNEGDTGKIGACAIVLMPDFDVPNPNRPGPVGDVVLSVRFLESPLFNMADGGTGLSCEKLALRGLHIFHHWDNEVLGAILYGKQDALRPYNELSESGIIGYDVIVRGATGIASGDKVEACAIGGSAAAVTITCTTPGAAIYYTTDGSYPASKNTAANSYAAPFAVEAGTLVRAGAEHPDKVSGNPIQHQF